MKNVKKFFESEEEDKAKLATEAEGDEQELKSEAEGDEEPKTEEDEEPKTESDEEEVKAEAEGDGEPKTEEDEDELKSEAEGDEEPKTEEDEEEKKVVAEKKKRSESADEEETFKLSEELDDLLEAELDSTLKDKIDVAFNTIVKEKVKKIREELDADNKEELKESISALEKAVGVYVEQAAQFYIKENKLALSEGLRTKYFESFFGKLKKLFKENYVELSESDEDLVADLKKENDELKDKTDELVTEMKKLNESVLLLNREKQIAKAASDMYLTESERFKSAASDLLKESVKLTEEKFTKKLNAITEMFKTSSKKKVGAKMILSEGNTKVVNENKDAMHPDVSQLLRNW